MSLINVFKISLFLSLRQIKRANIWVNILIIFIMAITFLNLVSISGLLSGIVTGASQDSRNHYSGDIIVTPQDDKINIINSNKLLEDINNLEEVDFTTVRYLAGVQVEKDRTSTIGPNIKKNNINTTLTGIDFEKENKVTNLEDFIIAGEYVYDINNRPRREIIIGSGLLDEYESAIGGNVLKNVRVGDKIKISASGNPREYIVGGIVKSKLSQINNRIFIDKQQFITITGRSIQNIDEIVITIENDRNLEEVKESIATLAINHQAKTETWQESQGQFFEDLSLTFSILGAVIGAVGLAVASVTLFIVIFINAISREKYIGILKGIGIESSIIKYSYVLQSVFYALIGSLIGLAILYIFLVPYFYRNPIDFPFSDGILDVTYSGVLLRILILFFSSVIAGFIPAYFIVRKNTIDSILGR